MFSWFVSCALAAVVVTVVLYCMDDLNFDF